LVESGTGAIPRPNPDLESAPGWMYTWPPSIYQRLRTLKMDRIIGFMLKAISQHAITAS